MELLDMVQEAVERLVVKLRDRVVAVALFGSLARGEAKERSDVDLFVVVNGMSKGLERRFIIYDTVHKILKTDVTIIDVDEEDLFKKELEITPMLLDVAWDALVLYDPSKRLSKLFEEAKTIIKRLKLERYQTRDGKYGWKSKIPGRLAHLEV